VQLSFRDEATRRLVRVLLKMAVKFKDTGKWPATLDELTGPGMEQCRIDPFTGKDLILKPLGPRTAPYSVGPNGVDDDGSIQKDVVFWTNVAADPVTVSAPPPTTQPAEEADKKGGSKDNKDAPDTPPPGSGSV
jgi:hypothetical protein